MVLNERRRPRLAEHETDTSYEVYMEVLDRLVESRENFPKAEIIYKILWRYDHYKRGPPKYPKIISWDSLVAYVAQYGGYEK